MKRKIRFIFYIAYFAAVRCSDPVAAPDEDQSNSFASYIECLKVDSTTLISIDEDFNNTTKLTFAWQADQGVITGHGQTAVFSAPNAPCTTTIKVTVTDDESLIFQKTFSILIYRQFVLLKADDMRFDPKNIISPEWRRFLLCIQHHNIKASVGLIGYSLLVGDFHYFSFLKQLNESGHFELWNHGYTHMLSASNNSGEHCHEFYKKSYDYQKRHMQLTQNLAREKLGITLHTFGAPGNATDANTLRLIDASDDITVWFNGDSASTKLVLYSRSHIEFPCHNPDFEKFVDKYNPESDVLLYGLHPDSWNDKKSKEFEKAIEFLTARNVTFLTPNEFWRLQSASSAKILFSKHEIRKEISKGNYSCQDVR